jgi:hypothetical protein
VRVKPTEPLTRTLTGRPAALTGRLPAGPGAFLVYSVLAIAFFGLPLLLHPGRSYVGLGSDPQIFIWCLGWWPHAVAHGTNPFVPHLIWAPYGTNLAWVTCVPGLAGALAPVTALAGPTVAYNVAALAMPALAATTAFLLCRHVTNAFWPSLAGGYLFGFSSYMLGQVLGHLNMSAVFCLPLIALFVLRFLDGGLGTAGLVVRLGPTLALQLSLSTEVAFTATLALAVALVGAVLALPERRARLRRVMLPVAASYVLAAVLTAPLLYFVLSDFERESISDPRSYPADLANLVVPTRLALLDRGWAWRESPHFAGNVLEQGAYLGLPLLLVIGLFAWSRRRRRSTWLLLALLGLALLAALGAKLTVAGHRSVWLPWSLLVDLPLFDNALPARLSVFATLLAAVIAALWAANSGAPVSTRLLLLAVAIALLVPNVRASYWRTTPVRPSFFSSGLYRACLRPDDNVLALPYGGGSTALLWQAEHGFGFRLADAYLGPQPPLDLPDRAHVLPWTGERFDAGSRRALAHAVNAQHVTVVLASTDNVARVQPLVSGLPHPQITAGVALWWLDGRGARSRCR